MPYERSLFRETHKKISRKFSTVSVCNKVGNSHHCTKQHNFKMTLNQEQVFCICKFPVYFVDVNYMKKKIFIHYTFV